MSSSASSQIDGKALRKLARLKLRKDIVKSWQLYIVILLPLIYLIVFKFAPMYGAQIAFRDYNFKKGFLGSSWVGLKHFERFISQRSFWKIIRNTLSISVYSLVASFPFPIMLALSLNYVKNERFKKTVQMVTYAPHFISVVVMVGILMQFLGPRTGIVNKAIVSLGGEAHDLLAMPQWFSTIFVWSNIWQNVGYNSIIFLAGLAGIDPALHEAAIMDGATKAKRMWHIDLPGIMPTAIIMLIMNAGRVLDVGFEKVLLMQNPLNLRTSEVIATYVYKIGLESNIPNFSYATAIGLMKSFIGMIIIIVVNKIAAKVSESSLW